MEHGLKLLIKQTIKKVKLLENTQTVTAVKAPTQTVKTFSRHTAVSNSCYDTHGKETLILYKLHRTIHVVIRLKIFSFF